MKRVVHKLILVVCALYLCGAHWALLQMTAWTGMLMSRAKTAGVAEAVQTTFDGQHPCDLCTLVATGKAEEKKTTAVTISVRELLELKLVSLRAAELPLLMAGASQRWMVMEEICEARNEVPPTPPPLA